MNVLGVSAFRGPCAACLLRDGRVVAASREDRFSRRLGDSDFPYESIAYCLRAGKLGPDDVSAVAFAGGTDLPDSDSGETANLKERVRRWLGPKQTVADLVSAELDPSTPVRFVAASRAHAAGAYYTSPLPDAAVLVLGAGANASLWRGRGAALEPVRALEAPFEGIGPLVHSLHEETGADAFALGGPLAAERGIVGTVRRDAGFADLWIHPAAGGGAEAIGAAFDVWLQSGAPTAGEGARRERPGAAPGPGYNAHEIRTFLRSHGIDSTELTPEEQTSLATDSLVGGLRLAWFAGRLDLAEDATATRSTLRRPTSSAPLTDSDSLVVPKELASEILELEHTEVPAFLDAVVRGPWRERCGVAPATSHLQPVFLADRDAHRELHAVLEALEGHGEPPALAARPLARAGEPVACSPGDAYEAWGALALDALRLGPYLLRSPRSAPTPV